MPAEKFEQKPPEIKPEEIKEEPKTKAEMKKEWREHFGPLAEIEEEKEKIEKAAKRAEKREQKKGWKEHFGELAEMQLAREKAEREAKKEKKALESAKIPVEGMKTEAILKEAGIEKPAESFEGFQKSLAEKIEQSRTYKGERLSESDKLLMARNEHLKELGYSVKYKGLLLDKIEIRDENNKPFLNEKGKPIEFKSFYFSKTERQVNDFLKDKLKEKMEGKLAKEMSEEEKQEVGLKKTISGAKKEQGTRLERISSLQDVKKVGRERLEKIMGGLSYVAALDKLGIFGLKEGGKLAVEGGKDLAAIGLTPAAAVEEAGRYVAGVVQVGEALRKSAIAREKAQLLERVPVDQRQEYFNDLWDAVMTQGSEKASQELIKGYDKIYKKGKILRLIEIFGGRLSRPIGRTFGPPPPRRERI